MAVYLVVDKKTSIIVNVIEWDGVTPYTPPECDAVDLIHYPDRASPGWLWDGKTAIDPNPPSALEAVPLGGGNSMTVVP